MLQKISKICIKILNVSISFSLASMAILVFGNVILRYIFNSGITWSEEMSRFLFVWLVFLGAIACLKDNMHLGVDVVVNALPLKLKKIAFVISNLLVLYILWLLLIGSWKMTVLNMNSTAPATGLPLSFLYGIGVITSVSMAIIIIVRMIQAFTSKSNSQFSIISSTEEVIKQ
ncbi:TRAP transporter small permease [Bacillus sp. 1P02SD]|uniref:TRAP transporter small permease n=1 Tax=Bacillus sp. 1P02SD TaxID=3132264 RepID=UPI0039A29581